MRAERVSEGTHCSRAWPWMLPHALEPFCNSLGPLSFCPPGLKLRRVFRSHLSDLWHQSQDRLQMARPLPCWWCLRDARSASASPLLCQAKIRHLEAPCHQCAPDASALGCQKDPPAFAPASPSPASALYTHHRPLVTCLRPHQTTPSSRTSGSTSSSSRPHAATSRSPSLDRRLQGLLPHSRWGAS